MSTGRRNEDRKAEPGRKKSGKAGRRRRRAKARAAARGSTKHPFFRRLWSPIRSVLGLFPLSLAGLLVATGSGLALFYYGLQRIDLILLAVGAIGLGLVALALVLSICAALLTWWHARGASMGSPGKALRVECGYWAATGYSLPSLWYLPFIHISWAWEAPEATVEVSRRRRRLIEEIRARRRNTAREVVRRFVIGDIFGLASISFSRRERRTVRFLPWVGSLKQMHVVRGMAGGEELSHPEGPPEGDRYDLRRYVPGDPVRFVLWKVFAKTRTLMVRTPEQAISPARQTVAYLVAGHEDEAAAGACRVAVDGGALGSDWKLGADGCQDIAESREQALEVLVQSAKTEPTQSGAGLGAFLQLASRGAVGRAVVFVPSTPGPWLDRVVAGARGMTRRAAQLDFVVGTDGIHRGARRSWWSRMWLGRRRQSEGAIGGEATDSDEVAEVVKTLGGARLNVLVVDRPNGQVFTQKHLGLMRS